MPTRGAVSRDGWLCVPYDGHDVALVEIGVGEPATWYSAFLDFLEGQRVAKIRPPGEIRGNFVRLRVNNIVIREDRYMG